MILWPRQHCQKGISRFTRIFCTALLLERIFFGCCLEQQAQLRTAVGVLDVARLCLLPLNLLRSSSWIRVFTAAFIVFAFNTVVSANQLPQVALIIGFTPLTDVAVPFYCFYAHSASGHGLFMDRLE